jgi:hypothetical protein
MLLLPDGGSLICPRNALYPCSTSLLGPHLCVPCALLGPRKAEGMLHESACSHPSAQR